MNASSQTMWTRVITEGDSIKLANVVTLTRAVLIVPIAVLLGMGFNLAALALHIAAAATDVVDGWLARRSHRSSAFGAQLDAWVDNFFSIATLTFLVVAYPGLWVRHGMALAILFGAPITYLALSYALRRRFLMYHFWSAKLGALLLFCLWPLVALTQSELMIPITAAVIGFSRLEQLVFMVRGGFELNATHCLKRIVHNNNPPGPFA